MARGAAGAQPAAEATLELALDPAPQPPYQGEMVLATLRGRYVGNVALEEIAFPPILDFSWLQLTPAEWTQERVGARAVNSFELRLAFYPERHGALTIPSIRHALTLSDGAARREVTAASAPVEIAVAQRPPTGTEWWIAARDVTLRDEWEPRPDRLAPQEWTYRTVTLEVDGQPPYALPGAPPMYAGGLFTFEEPEERTVRLTADGPVSTIVWRYRMKPQTDAPADLDDIPISWFDTEARQGRSLLLEGRYIAFAASALPRTPGPVARWGAPVGALAGVGLGAALAGSRLGVGRSGAAGRLRRRMAAARAAARLGLAERRGDAAGARAALLALVARARGGARGVGRAGGARRAAVRAGAFGAAGAARAGAAGVPGGPARLTSPRP